MNDNLPNEYGFLGFERMGRKNNSIHKFGSGLKEMGLMWKKWNKKYTFFLFFINFFKNKYTIFY